MVRDEERHHADQGGAHVTCKVHQDPLVQRPQHLLWTMVALVQILPLSCWEAAGGLGLSFLSQ